MSENVLVFAVPIGCEPFEISVELVRHGFRAVEEHTGGAGTRLWIACPGGASQDRERVRQVIADALRQRAEPAPEVTFDGETAR